MLDSIYHITLTQLKIAYLTWNVKVLSSFTQRYNGRHNATLLKSVNRYWFIDLIELQVKIYSLMYCFYLSTKHCESLCPLIYKLYEHERKEISLHME